MRKVIYLVCFQLFFLSVFLGGKTDYACAMDEVERAKIKKIAVVLDGGESIDCKIYPTAYSNDYESAGKRAL